MSQRWGKTVVVPLDSLCKEKENTERIARSVGTVGKWGKMGFTSTRTYALSALPAAVAAGLAASVASPGTGQNPALSPFDDDLNTTVAEPPKPKKFFKSRNAAPPEVIAQIIQQLPRSGISPSRDLASTSGNAAGVAGRDSNKVKTTKASSKKTPKKSPKVPKQDKSPESGSTKVTTPETIPKPKKKKEEKKLKPEAPPSRVTSRARKAVNYCEDDEDERMPTPIKDIIMPKSKNIAKETVDDGIIEDTTLPPPSVAPKTPEHPPIVLRISKGTSRLVSTDSEEQQLSNTASGSPREENDCASLDISKSRHTSTDEIPAAVTQTTPKIVVKPPKPPSPEPEPEAVDAPPALDYEETPEFNYCEVKISPDKPPKERLKLIIKTDVLRHALAAAKAAEKQQAAAALISATPNGSTIDHSERPEKEKKQKGKKHKHTKHTAAASSTTTEQQQQQQQLTPASSVAEFKTPSPHISLSTSIVPTDQTQNQSRTVISPPAISERDFDSQSSVLGSNCSSKGNSTPQPTVQIANEECRVVHSRGSSVITSDLETSQQSSMVAAPSDIESRLESMMMTDGEVSQPALIESMTENEASLQKEDIIAVLRGDELPVNHESNALPLESSTTTTEQDAQNVHEPVRSPQTEDLSVDANELGGPRTTRRRGRPRQAAKSIKEYEEQLEEQQEVPKTQIVPRTRGRKQTAAIVETESSPPKRSSRRVAKKTTTTEEDLTTAMEQDTPPLTGSEHTHNTVSDGDKRLSPNKSEEENTTPVSQLQQPQDTNTTTTVTTRRGRSTRSSSNNNSLSSNNNNINKIAASLSAKAGAAEAEASKAITQQQQQQQQNSASTTVTRTYGRKRKNQQVTQVLQPSAEELEVQQHKQPQQSPTPAKVPNLEFSSSASETAAAMHTANSRLSNEEQPRLPTANTPILEQHETSLEDRSAILTAGSPPRHDYKVKDKFKRTLTLDSQATCNAVESTTSGTMSLQNSGSDPTAASAINNDEDEQQRGSVKLVISKKKGSIFKSRTLVQPDQGTDQAGVGKRLLYYKHSWDAAEANGVTPNEGGDATNPMTLTTATAITTATTAETATGGVAAAATAAAVGAGTGAATKATIENPPAVQKPNTRNPIDNIFDDFGEDVSNNAHDARESPSIGKLMRVIKPNPQASNAPGSSSHHTFEFDADNAAISSDIVSGKADRKAKGYYTVVRNVMTAHQIQEIGEYQEMDDDVEYILDALQPHNPTPTRCLSALQLATKCMTPAFRMHVRAHSVVTKFFKALSDANNDLSLGLCTSAIMFILSQESLNMDLDRDSLELMVNLLESETIAAPSDRANYERNKQKVRELCEEMKAQGKATHLNMDSITVGTLAMETLLSLTSKRAGEWFKEELRQLGGLEHIIKTISDCCRPIIELHNINGTKINWTQSLLENIQTVERCMRVLENVTQMNEENQKYMLKYSKGAAVNTLCTLYSLCDRELMLYPTTEHTNRDNPGVVMRELLIPIMKVLINLTHTFNPMKALGAETLGQRIDIIDVSFHLLLQAPNYIPERCIFELSILVLLLLINLSMYTIPNRDAIMKTYVSPEFGTRQGIFDGKITAVHAIMEYFYKCEELARLVEKNTDAFLDNQDKTKKKQEEVDETVNNLLQKAGHHMEHTLKGSYAAILIGHLVTDNEEYEATVRTQLRGNGFKDIVNVLEKYYTFMNLTASSESAVVAHIKSTKKLIDYFKKRDLVYESNDCAALPLNLETRHVRSPNDLSSASTEAAGTSTETANTTATSSQRSSSTTHERMYKTYSQR